MNNKPEIIINSIEDLVAYATANTFNADKRWELEDRTGWEFVDAEAGRKWNNESPKYVSINLPGRKEYEIADAEHDKTKPKEIQVTRWTLQNQYRGYREGEVIHLSTEMGELLDSIWTKKAKRWDPTPRRTSFLTMPGMLKRLGVTGVAEQVKAAKKAAEDKQAKNSRNYARREAQKLATELVNLMHKNSEIVWSTSGSDSITIQDILDLKMEE